MDLIIRSSAIDDVEGIVNLLKVNNLPTSDIHQNSIQFFVANIDENIVGAVGIEQFTSIGLLRSLAVKDELKNQKIGEKLLYQLFGFCKRKQINELYLLTTTAEKYFLRYGFKIIDRQSVPEIIKQTSEFKDICPQSAVVMHIMLVD